MTNFLTNTLDFLKGLLPAPKPEQVNLTTGLGAFQGPQGVNQQGLVTFPTLQEERERAGLSGGLIPGSILGSGPIGQGQTQLGAKPGDVTTIETQFGPQPIPKPGAEIFEIGQGSLGLRDLGPGGFAPQIRPAVIPPQQPQGPSPSGPTFPSFDPGISNSLQFGPVLQQQRPQLPQFAPSQAPSGFFGIGGSQLGQLPGQGTLDSFRQIQGLPGTLTRPTGSDEEEEQRRLRELLAQQQRRVLPPAQEPLFNVPTPTGEVSIPETVSQQAQGLISQGDAQSFQQTIELLNNEALRLKEQIQRQNPTPEVPVVPTVEQQQFEQANPGLRGQLDKIRLQAGLPEFEKQRIDKMTELQAINQLYTKVVEDVRTNPELPKGLAARRIAELNREFGTRINQLQGELGILNQQINDANDLVNQQFGIIKDERAEQERQRDNTRQQISLLTTSGGLANLSPDQLRALEQASGFEPNVLDGVVKSLNNKQLDESQRIQRAQERLNLALQREERLSGTSATPQAGGLSPQDELTSDITAGRAAGRSDEEIIRALVPAYPEFTEQQIRQMISGGQSVARQTDNSFFNRLFGTQLGGSQLGNL